MPKQAAIWNRCCD